MSDIVLRTPQMPQMLHTPHIPQTPQTPQDQLARIEREVAIIKRGISNLDNRAQTFSLTRTLTRAERRVVDLKTCISALSRMTEAIDAQLAQIQNSKREIDQKLRALEQQMRITSNARNIYI
jgi:chromosome segregation ATPase